MNKIFFGLAFLSAVLCSNECFPAMKLIIQPIPQDKHEKFEISLKGTEPTVNDLISKVFKHISDINQMLSPHEIAKFELSYTGKKLEEKEKLSKYNISSGSKIQLNTTNFDPFSEKVSGEEPSAAFTQSEFNKIMIACDALNSVPVVALDQNQNKVLGVIADWRKHLKHIEDIAKGHSQQDLIDVLSVYPRLNTLQENWQALQSFERAQDLGKTFRKATIAIWVSRAGLNKDNRPKNYKGFTYQPKKEKATSREIPPLHKKLTALRDALRVLGQKTSDLQTKLQELKTRLGD